MQKINININHAKIKSFHVTLNDDLPSLLATIGLYTPSGIQISEYSIQTNHWDESKKFDIPPSVIDPILRIAKALEKIVVESCESQQKLLSEVKNAD